MKILKILIPTIIVLAAVVFITNHDKNQTTKTNLPTIKIGETVIKVEIADTSEKRTLGLGGKPDLPQNEGMLFVFDNEDYHTFWMKDMNFPLDLIWIGSDMKVVDRFKNATPDTYPKYAFKPDRPAKYVLEVNAGWLEDNKINLGDKVVFSFK